MLRPGALDYIEGWLRRGCRAHEARTSPRAGEASRGDDSASGKSVLSQMVAKELVDFTRAGGARRPHRRGGKQTSPSWIFTRVRLVRRSSRRIESTILHLARWNGRWVIVNVLWEFSAEATKDPVSQRRRRRGSGTGASPEARPAFTERAPSA